MTNNGKHIESKSGILIPVTMKSENPKIGFKAGEISKATRLAEGWIKKGGRNDPPTTPRPPAPQRMDGKA